MSRRPLLLGLVLPLGLALGCVGVGCTRQSSVPEPDALIDSYAAALERGDVDALYAMMSEESRRAISKKELEQVIAKQKAELEEHAKALKSKDRSVEAQAEVRYADGEIVALDLEEGTFRLTAAEALPASARTPAQALVQLRKVLARRSYAGLMRVLSPRTRAAVEKDLRSLVEGLTEPESLQIDVVGDAATVSVPGGHQVKLRREDGIWHIDDFN
jgi:hypothetical protein